jgi:diguanylate cyclase (GGDEF)-like protein
MRSLRNQILLLCVGIVVVTSLAILTSFWVNTSQYTREQVDQTIQKATDAFTQLLTTREAQLITSAQLLTSDFGFKQAVATRDVPTINSALFNHSARVDADLMFLTNLDGLLRASTNPQLIPDQYFAHPRLIEAAAEQGGAVSFVRIVDELYQIVILPVRAPIPIAFVGVGFKLDNQIADELKVLTNLEVSFVINGETGTNIISTLDDAQVDAAIGASTTLDPLFGLPFAPRQAFASRNYELQGDELRLGRAVLSANLTSAYQSSQMLRNEISLITLAILLLAVAGSVVLARNIANPLKQLIDVAQKMARGDYSSLLAIPTRTAEISTLFKAFSSMEKDIREREVKITFQAQHDNLTGLLNRVTLMDKLAQDFILQQRPAVVISLNIRGFRNINDSFGQKTGDDCLIEVARRLEAFDDTLLASGAMHARLGADEYVSVLPLVDTVPAEQLCVALLTFLQRPLVINDLTVDLYFTAGYVEFPTLADTAEDLMRRSNIALERARKDLQPLRSYLPGEDEEHLLRLGIMNDLGSALRADDGQLFMCYQPKLHLESGRIDKLEALIRWRHPEQGFISPEMFVALAEKSTLITEMTDWVIATVIKQSAAWQETYPDLQIAINISAKDLEREELLPQVNTLLSQYGLSTNRLCFEMTERDMMLDPERAVELMTRFTSAGFDLSVDDYGIGHSSLSRIKQMPITEIKIDRSFITYLDTSAGDQIIVRSTIDLGHGFKLKVIAEGVESAAAQTLLHNMGCDYIQGYHLSRPLEAQQVDDFMRQFSQNQAALAGS